jgi:uncharacterized membrane protein YgcG
MQPPRTPKAARTAACWPRRAASAPTADAPPPPPPPPPPWTSKVELFSSFSSVTPARVCCGGQQIRGARPRIQWRRTRGCCAVVCIAGSGRSRPGSAGNGAGGMGNGRRGGGGAGRGTGSGRTR